MGIYRTGYAWRVRHLREADYYFKEQIKYCTESIKWEGNMQVSNMLNIIWQLPMLYRNIGKSIPKS